MPDDESRYVPTPEEVEAGEVRRARHAHPAEGEEADRESLGVRLRRKLGVGRRRTYVQVRDSAAELSDVEEQPSAKATALPTEELDPAPLQSIDPEGGANVDETDRPPITGGSARVESVNVPRRPSRRSSAPTKLGSREADFYKRASAKGHKMGQLQNSPHNDELTATCETCGASGTIAIQYYENWSTDVSNYVYRGHAIERSCQ